MWFFYSICIWGGSTYLERVVLDCFPSSWASVVVFITSRVIPIRTPQEGEGNDRVGPALSPFLKISISGSLRGEEKSSGTTEGRSTSGRGWSLPLSHPLTPFRLAGDEGWKQITWPWCVLTQVFLYGTLNWAPHHSGEPRRWLRLLGKPWNLGAH